MCNSPVNTLTANDGDSSHILYSACVNVPKWFVPIKYEIFVFLLMYNKCCFMRYGTPDRVGYIEKQLEKKI